MQPTTIRLDEHLVVDEPFYQARGDEVGIFESSYRNHLPVLLKGPTGCGKTRFMEYMAWRLKRPLITVSCHDDLTRRTWWGVTWSREARPPGSTAR